MIKPHKLYVIILLLVFVGGISLGGETIDLLIANSDKTTEVEELRKKIEKMEMQTKIDSIVKAQVKADSILIHKKLQLTYKTPKEEIARKQIQAFLLGTATGLGIMYLIIWYVASSAGNSFFKK